MGELVAGTPALRLEFRTSPPLDFTLALSLLYRAVPGSGLDSWLVATRRGLSRTLREDLDFIHGFSGRLILYPEELVMSRDPFPDDRDEETESYLDFLDSLPAEEFRTKAISAVSRVHRSLGIDDRVPSNGDEVAWRRFLAPALTTATCDETVTILADPEQLKLRTLRLFRGVWGSVYQAEQTRWAPTLSEAALRAQPHAERGFGQVFADLTDSRLPAPLLAGLDQIARVVFCPTPYLGTFISYLRYPPDLVVFFDGPRFLNQSGRSESVAAIPDAIEAPTEGEELLAGLRALADPTRLRILDYLTGGERYAQEVVSYLPIGQSAVSRHLSVLERAGLVNVRPRGGMKYYAVAADRLDAVGQALRARAGTARS